MAGDLEFTYRSARSAAITSAIVAAVVIESVAVHFAVAARHPGVAWTLTLMGLAAIFWLVRDYKALGSGRVRLTNDELHLEIGRRFDTTIPVMAVARSLKPTFRDMPTPGTNQGRDFLNLTKPATPNVLLVLDEPRRVNMMAGMHRNISRIALRLDDPTAFLTALDERRAVFSPPSA